MHLAKKSLVSVFVFAASVLTICLASLPVGDAQQAPKPVTMAQKLVNDTHANHPEAAEIGIAVIGAKGCSSIASTDKSDIGEKCEKDDSEPIRTGKPFVEKEKDSFDISLPLHDANGKLVGSVGIELKAQSGQTQSDLVQQAQKIATEMEKSIPSKASLLRPF